MSAPTSGRLTQSLSIQANVSYDLLSQTLADGVFAPVLVGSGKFAKVYKAWQRSARRNVRPVAVKVLHDHATLSDERLFKQEIDLLKELTTVRSVNVIRTLDIVRVPPLAMCGCGVVYHPLCPRGCGQLLQRIERIEHNHPLLSCSRCGYELSAEDVEQRGTELLRPPAKNCCQGPKAQRGTLIHFVDREVVVMELIEHGLSDFALLQKQATLHTTHTKSSENIPLHSQPGTLSRSSLVLSDASEERLLQKALLCEKLHLMVQLAESLAWLHGERRIIHKDLAPDNVMVVAPADTDGTSDWRGEMQVESHERLLQIAACPRFSIKVIDFGLADKDELTRSWYEEQDVVAAAFKLPYTSPEARRRKERVSEPIQFVPGGACFVVPPSLFSSHLSLLPGDLLVDTQDTSHDHDLEIVRIEPTQSGVLAHVRGEPPPAPESCKFEVIRRLGEAHDVYALGALFYFVLTGKHEEVDRLGSLVNLLQEADRRDLVLRSLKNDQYFRARRDAIPEPFFRDELVMLCLRAMVRGRPQSLVSHRTDRGPEAAQMLLRETRALYREVLQDVMSEPLRKRVQQGLLLAVPSALALLFLLRSC
jgi:serine/threonine protein kinase